jgi:hypothetical protein
MADDHYDLEQLFRLMAVEFFITDMLANRYLASPDPVSTAREHRDRIRKLLSEISLPRLGDAAKSELAVGGFGDAIDRLLENAGEMACLKVDNGAGEEISNYLAPSR